MVVTQAGYEMQRVGEKPTCTGDVCKGQQLHAMHDPMA